MADQVCKYCGCHEAQACFNDKGEACYWVFENVCSSKPCMEQFIRENPGLSVYIDDIKKELQAK